MSAQSGLITADELLRLPRGTWRYRQQDAGVVMPTLVKRVDPEYSNWAFRQRTEGTTALEAVVASDGAIAEVHVTQSIDPSGARGRQYRDLIPVALNRDRF